MQRRLSSSREFLVPKAELMWTAIILEDSFSIQNKTLFPIGRKYSISEFVIWNKEEEDHYLYAACLDEELKVVIFGVLGMSNFYFPQTIPFKQNGLFPTSLCLIGDQLILSYHKREYDFDYESKFTMLEFISLTTKKIISTLYWDLIVDFEDLEYSFISELYSDGTNLIACIFINQEVKLVIYDTNIQGHPILIKTHNLPNDECLKFIKTIIFNDEYILILCKPLTSYQGETIFIFEKENFSNYDIIYNDGSFNYKDDDDDQLNRCKWNEITLIQDENILLIGCNIGIGLFGISYVGTGGAILRDDVINYTDRFSGVVEGFVHFTKSKKNMILLDNGIQNDPTLTDSDRYKILEIDEILVWLYQQWDIEDATDKNNSNQSNNNEWSSIFDVNSGWCPSCHEDPCMCSDPDPG